MKSDVLRATFTPQAASQTGPLPTYGFAAVYPQPFTGSLGAVSPQLAVPAAGNAFDSSTDGSSYVSRGEQRPSPDSPSTAITPSASGVAPSLPAVD